MSYFFTDVASAEYSFCELNLYLYRGQPAVLKQSQGAAESRRTGFESHFPQQTFRAPDPDAVAFALKGRRVKIVVHHVLEFGAREVGLVFREVKFGQLHFRARIGMAGGDLLPDVESGLGFAQRRQRLRISHERMAVIMFGIFAADAFEQRPRVGETFLPQQALSEMRARVEVVRLAFERGAITFFGLGQFAALKINIAELEMMIGVVEMMDLRLKFLDALAALRAGQFKPARGRRRGAIDEKEIKHRRQSKADENKNGPKPFLPPERVNEHPKLERKCDQPPRIVDQIIKVQHV